MYRSKLWKVVFQKHKTRDSESMWTISPVHMISQNFKMIPNLFLCFIKQPFSNKMYQWEKKNKFFW